MSRLDPSGADQSDAKHPTRKQQVGGSSPPASSQGCITVLGILLIATMATRTLQTISETAAQIRRCLAVGDDREALRWVAQTVAEFQRARSMDPAGLVADEPPPTGDPRWDAMLAGVVEQLCFDDELAAGWAMRPSRFLEQWWFVTPYPSLHPSAFAETPVALPTAACSFTASRWRASEPMLSRGDIVTLLNELASELEANGTHGDLFLVGGAAMALPTAGDEPPATWTRSSNQSR